MLKRSGPRMDPWGTNVMIFIKKYFYNVPALTFVSYLRGTL